MKPEFIFGILVLTLSMAGVLISWLAYDDGYKQGTIDALTGKARYQLVTMPDSTRVWEEIK